MRITVVIPTLGRDDVLVDSINGLLRLRKLPNEIIIVDQTDNHNIQTESQLKQWHDEKIVRWIRLKYKSITHAMNVALRKATSERVLFLDDDIIPDANLVSAHLEFADIYPLAIVAGRVLQPWHKGKADSPDQPFLFNSLNHRDVESFMGGNVSIPRIPALEIGGFDTNFVKVAYHFEAEFAHR